jgi:hypothetical protein
MIYFGRLYRYKLLIILLSSMFSKNNQLVHISAISWIAYLLYHECNYHILGTVSNSSGKCLHLYSVQKVWVISLNFPARLLEPASLIFLTLVILVQKNYVEAIVDPLDTSLITGAGLISYWWLGDMQLPKNSWVKAHSIIMQLGTSLICLNNFVLIRNFVLLHHKALFVWILRLFYLCIIIVRPKSHCSLDQ